MPSAATQIRGVVFKLKGHSALAFSVPLPADLSDDNSCWVNIIPGEGHWAGHGDGEFEITEDTVDSLVANFEKRETPVKFDYEHASHSLIVEAQGDLVPSSGHLFELEKRDGDNGAQLWGLVKWTARAADAIRAEEAQYNSPVIAFEWDDAVSGEDQGATLLSVALTDMPFFQGQQPIHLNSFTQRGKSMTIKLDAIKAAKAKGVIHASILEALDRVKAQLTEASTRDDLFSFLYDELDKEVQREVIEEVLVEAGVIAATEDKPEVAAAEGDEDKDEVAAAEDDPEEKVEAAEDDPDEVAAADEDKVEAAEDDAEKVEGAEDDEVLEPSADGLVQMIAEAAGISSEDTLAKLTDMAPAIIEQLTAAADTEDAPGGSAMSDKDTERLARQARLREAALTASAAKLEKRLTKLEARDAKRDKADAKAFTAKVAAEAKRLIDEGHATDESRDDLIAELTENFDRTARMFGGRKIVPTLQATEDATTPAVTALSELTEQERLGVKTLMAMRLFGQGKSNKEHQQACIDRVVARRN